MNLGEMLKKMQPEGIDVFNKRYFLDVLNSFENPFARECPFHFTSSGFVVNKEKTKVLCIYHNIYASYTIPGGHNDGEEDSLAVALREVEEETGITNLTPLSLLPFAIQIAPVAGHVRRGAPVSPHIHLDATFLFEADESEGLKIKEDENSDVCWLTFEELLQKSTEKHMIPLYDKIINRVKRLKEKQ